MCLEESFCPFTRDALNFRAAENICLTASPSSVQVNLPRPSLLRRVTLRSIIFCSVTAHAHRKSRVRSNNMPTRKV